MECSSSNGGRSLGEFGEAPAFVTGIDSITSKERRKLPIAADFWRIFGSGELDRNMIAIRGARVEDVEGIGVCLESAFDLFGLSTPVTLSQDTVPSPEAIRQRMIHRAVYVAVDTSGEIVGTPASAIEGEEGHLRG